MLGQKSRRGKEGQDLLDPLQVILQNFPNWAKLEAEQIWSDVFCPQLRLLEGADDQMDIERQGSVRQVSFHFDANSITWAASDS